MPNGIWDRDTFLDCPDKRTQDAMTFDMLKALNDHMVEICKQPGLCEVIMDDKIKAERKRRGRINIGLGSGGGVGAFGILEVIRRWLNSG